MTDTATNRKRGNSKPNVTKRGSTYTYYVYVTGPMVSASNTARAVSRPSGRRRRHAWPRHTRWRPATM
jgi:hypothetical protein